MKQVLTPSFWKQRLMDVPNEDHLHFSVLTCPKEDWHVLHRMHLTIIHKHINVTEDKVLDLGCGYGRIAKYINNYTGADLSPDLLNIAKKQNPDKTFVECDGRSLPFEDNEFNWTVKCIDIDHSDWLAIHLTIFTQTKTAPYRNSHLCKNLLFTIRGQD